jgi:hypothetical protein
MISQLMMDTCDQLVGLQARISHAYTPGYLWLELLDGGAPTLWPSFMSDNRVYVSPIMPTSFLAPVAVYLLAPVPFMTGRQPVEISKRRGKRVRGGCG